MKLDRKIVRVPIRNRIRGKISGTEEKPRVAIYRSLRQIYLQAIDDSNGATIAHASTMDPELNKKLKKGGGNVEAATKAGDLMAKRLKEKGITRIIFDRGGFLYHGRIRAAAEAMRKAGLEF